MDGDVMGVTCLSCLFLKGAEVGEKIAAAMRF